MWEAGWETVKEIKKASSPRCTGPLMGPGGSERSGLWCVWRGLIGGSSYESPVAASRGRRIRLSPFAGPWSGPEFVKQLQEIMSVIHS